jgi:hypothetical protein
MAEPDFRNGQFDIRYLETHRELFESAGDESTLRIVALAAAMLEHEARKRRATDRIDRQEGRQNGWRSRGWRP